MTPQTIAMHKRRLAHEWIRATYCIIVLIALALAGQIYLGIANASAVCSVCMQTGESSYVAPIPDRVDALPDAMLDCCPCCTRIENDLNPPGINQPEVI